MASCLDENRLDPGCAQRGGHRHSVEVGPNAVGHGSAQLLDLVGPAEEIGLRWIREVRQFHDAACRAGDMMCAVEHHEWRLANLGLTRAETESHMSGDRFRQVNIDGTGDLRDISRRLGDPRIGMLVTMQRNEDVCTATARRLRSLLQGRLRSVERVSSTATSDRR